MKTMIGALLSLLISSNAMALSYVVCAAANVTKIDIEYTSNLEATQNLLNKKIFSFQKANPAYSEVSAPTLTADRSSARPLICVTLSTKTESATK